MTKRIYCVILGVCLCIAFLFQIGQRPFGDDFSNIFIPALLLLNCLEWFLIPTKLVWKLVGFCSVPVLFSVLWFSFERSGRLAYADFATILFVSVAALNITFALLARDNETRKIAISVGLTSIFLILLGSYIVDHKITMLAFSNGRFLLLAPLVAMFFSVQSAAYEWHVYTQVIFLCSLIQIAIGLFDAGQVSHIRWMSICSVLIGLGVLTIAGYWAKEWNH